MAADTPVETNKVITVDKLTAGTITVTGNKEFSAAAILQFLPSLHKGQLLDIQTISNEVAFANNNPALKIAVDIQPQSPTTANVEVRVAEAKTFRNMITYDNTGDDQTGKNRMGYLAVDYNWLGQAQTAVFSYTRSPDNNKVDQFGFMNAIPLPKAGDTLTISGSYSNVNAGLVADYFNIAGNGKALGAHYTHNLKTSANHQASLDFGVDYKEYNNGIDFFGTNLGTNVNTLPVSVAFQYTSTGADSRFSGSLGFTGNLATASSSQTVFDNTRAGAVNNYTVWHQNATYQQQLNKAGWLLSTQLESQYADTPLISGEQFGLGGAHSVRGFGERALVGDKGGRLTTEIYTPEIFKGQKLLVFFDQGKYWLNNPQAGDIASQSISSCGLGWRLSTPGGTAIALDWAKVLRGTDATPKGSTKVHLFASQTF
ncbi:MAG: ShlB/FhaC/HecB family hemolysin secretion/activation protein [Negativicutes bacterium]|nr:ShlB/FhaC/HecB family hemolysin secretion/activation protein [Negativicutes bacterium]MDR3592840.1 ShlB/FhaC/HecB family hemolysin secretion/activation protein [Negativicutes bacterium]